jgi:hypothetical protein
LSLQQLLQDVAQRRQQQVEALEGEARGKTAKELERLEAQLAVERERRMQVW